MSQHVLHQPEVVVGMVVAHVARELVEKCGSFVTIPELCVALRGAIVELLDTHDDAGRVRW